MVPVDMVPVPVPPILYAKEAGIEEILQVCSNVMFCLVAEKKCRKRKFVSLIQLCAFVSLFQIFIIMILKKKKKVV